MYCIHIYPFFFLILSNYLCLVAMYFGTVYKIFLTCIIPFIKNFHNRVQCLLMIKGCLLSNIVAYYGVPQGSHLRPMLFLPHINVILNTFNHSKLFLFADKAELYLSYKYGIYTLCLEEDINSIKLWCKEKDMELN